MSVITLEDIDGITSDVCFDLLLQPFALFDQLLLAGGCALNFCEAFTQYPFAKFSFHLGSVCIVLFTNVARLDFCVVQDAFLPKVIDDATSDACHLINALSGVVQIVLVRYR